MPRHKNGLWDIPNEHLTWDMVQVDVLMDIRDELQRLNLLLGCSNFTGIPATLRQIKLNTQRKKARRSA